MDGPQVLEGRLPRYEESTICMISMIEDTTHSPDDLIWDDKVEDDTVVKLV
ncbi:hypothetical protein YC2023_007887 [Brassica napus]